MTTLTILLLKDVCSTEENPKWQGYFGVSLGVGEFGGPLVMSWFLVIAHIRCKWFYAMTYVLFFPCFHAFAYQNRQYDFQSASL